MNKKKRKSLQLVTLLSATLFLALFAMPPLWGEAQSVYDVTACGAIANDGASDSSAIQAALNQAKGSASIVTVNIPAGTYHLNGPLRIYSNTYLKLAADATLVRMDSAIGKNMIHAVDQNNQMDQIGGYAMCHDITLDGGTWDGGNVKDCGQSTPVSRFDHGTNITVKNASFKNVYNNHLMAFVGIKNGLIANCTFRGFFYDVNHKNQYEYGREAIQIESAWTENPSNLKDESGHWAKGTTIDGTHCDTVTVTDCTFLDFPSGVGQHHYSSSPNYSNSTNIVIKNNTITAGSQYTYFKTAIPCGGLDNVTIENNTIDGPYRYGILAYEGNHISLIGNTIKNTRQNAIGVLKGSVSVIKDNTIISSKKHGISLMNSTVGNNDSATGILNNTISSSKTNGICCSGKSTVSSIRGNTIINSGQHGISIVGNSKIGSKNISGSGITNNTIKGSRQNGISMGGNFVQSISANKILNCKNNGISFGKGTVTFITKNTIKKAKNGIYISKKKNLKKKLSGNKITNCKRKTI